MSPRPAQSRWWRRGVSFLEAALAMAMLAIVGMGLLTAVNAVWRHQLRQEQTLGAAELANRLILNFLDDNTKLPSENLPLDYGPYRYRWKKVEGRAVAEPAADLPDEVRRQRQDRNVRPILERFRTVTIRVWLSEANVEGDGSFHVTAATPQFEITRVYDPLFLGRNPDTLAAFGADPERLMRWLSEALNPGGTAPPPASPGATGRPRSGSGRGGGGGGGGSAGGER